jgi:dienelactone hydrolase
MNATWQPLRTPNWRSKVAFGVALAGLVVGIGVTRAAEHLVPGTEPLTMQGDLSEQMVAGIDQFLVSETERSVQHREEYWRRDFSSVEAYADSVSRNRERLRRMIGAGEPRLPVSALEFVADSQQPARVAGSGRCAIFTVRWPVFEGVHGEGLWLRPTGPVRARVVAVPDADQTPEMLAGLAPGIPEACQFARNLAERGCEVIVPVLVDRKDTWSGSATLRRFTNQPHREWIYRQSFELGRHIIGYEVQKVLAAVDFLEAEAGAGKGAIKLGVAGYGEGGLIALYAAALDTRIGGVLVSGYFDTRLRLWEEPIYRNLFGVLAEFGDAEIASLVAPRCLVVEHSVAPEVNGPPPASEVRSGAAPGIIRTPGFQSVVGEFQRACELLREGPAELTNHFHLVSDDGKPVGPGSDRALLALFDGIGGIPASGSPSTNALRDVRGSFNPGRRQQRQVAELEDYTQRIFRQSERARAKFFWSKMPVGSTQEWSRAITPFKVLFEEQVIGRFSSPEIPFSAKSRHVLEKPKWDGYEVMIDVYPEVFAWGYLLVPKDLRTGEQRPVVVCQHGLEGVPFDVINDDKDSSGYGAYQAFAARLAEHGFVVFAPHNPYRGGDRFRVLQRKANPLGTSLYSIIIAQHRRIVEWLAALPFVDAKRIGFYGLSYGGKTAMRVPAVVDGYALSICSGDFNDWIGKVVSTAFEASYVYTGEYEIPEWNMGTTFNYAELAALIAPRPFMVERGHRDGVAIDEWVAYEYAKVRRLYTQLGIGQNTEIEYFDGPHTIHGVGSFEFLHRYLDWRAPGK